MPLTQQLTDLVSSFRRQRPLLIALDAACEELYNLAARDTGHQTEAMFVGRAPLVFVTFAQRKNVERADYTDEILVADAVPENRAHERAQRFLDGIEKYRALVFWCELQFHAATHG